MGGIGTVGGADSSARSQADEEARRAEAARQTPPAPPPVPALRKVAGLYLPQVSAETIANLQKTPAVLQDLSKYDDPLLDREITATRARLANSSGAARNADELNLKALETEVANRRAAVARQQDAARVPPLMADLGTYSVDKLEAELKAATARVQAKPGDDRERAGLEMLQKELANRLRPELLDIDALKTDPEVLHALNKEVAFLSRFKDAAPPEVRRQHEATLKKLEEKHDGLYAQEHACDNAKVATAKFPNSANNSYELQFTADDLVATLKQRMPLSAKEEEAVRKQFNTWRSDQCTRTGEDPTRIRNEEAQHAVVNTTALREAEMQKRREMLEASAGSVCAALAFVDSSIRGDSVDTAYTRVMGARALSDTAQTMLHGPQAHPDTTEKAQHTAVQSTPARPAAPSATVRPKPAATVTAQPAGPPIRDEGGPPLYDVRAPVTAPIPLVTTKPGTVPADETPRTLRTGPPAGPATAAVRAAGTSAVAPVEPFSSPSGRFRTKEMRGYRGEDLPGNPYWDGGKPVTYCRTVAARAQYRLHVETVTENGRPVTRIYGADNKPFDTRSSKVFDGGNGRAIFVMNADGEIFASKSQIRGEFHHSSLAGGQPVAAAGELVIENGRLVEITNRSGHYRPEVDFTNQALASFQNQGVNLSGVKVIDDATKQERVFP